MKNCLSGFSLLLLFSGCASQTVPQGIKDILAFYGGSVNYSVGVSVSSGNSENSGKFYQIVLDSTDVKKYFESEDLPASNCAYILYHSLSGKEKSDYSFIRIIISEYSRSEKYDFRMERLHQVEQCMPTLTRVVDCLKYSRYRMLRTLFSPSIPADSIDDKKIEQPNMAIDSAYGHVSKFTMNGFYFTSPEIAGRSTSLVHIAGVLIREKQNTNFSVSVGSDEGYRNLYGFGFKE